MDELAKLMMKGWRGRLRGDAELAGGAWLAGARLLAVG